MQPPLKISKTLLGVYYVHVADEKLHETARRLHCSTLDLVDDDLDALRDAWPTAIPEDTTP